MLDWIDLPTTTRTVLRGGHPSTVLPHTRPLRTILFGGLGLGLRVGVLGSVDPNCYPHPNPNNNPNPTLTLNLTPNLP